MKKMDNCIVTISMQDGKLKIQAEKVSLVELATLSGYFQTFIGIEAVKRGMDLDTAKDNLLEVCLTASQQLDEIIRKG